MKKYLSLVLISMFLISCQTIDVEKKTKNEMKVERKKDVLEVIDDSLGDNTSVIVSESKSDDEVYIIQESENQPVQKEIIIDPPDVILCDEVKETPELLGDAALKQNLKDKTIVAEYSEGRLKGWTYKEGNIYQIHTQTYHSTIIQFEPGEEMLEVPYISEPDVWRLSRGIGIKNGKDTQYLIVKPDYSGLISTLIVITNYRVYQMELKSYKDHYMPYVSWIYPQSVIDGQSWYEWQQREMLKKNYDFTGTNIENCSFDYKITHPYRKPIWCPELVYDDGRFTYIVLNKKALQTEIPGVFIDSRKLINVQIHKNVIVINQLVTKVSLRLGKTKVKITKKKSHKRFEKEEKDIEIVQNENIDNQGNLNNE